MFKYVSLFMNAFLARRKSRDIHKFRLSCEFSALYADTWIRTAIGPYLEELHLALFSEETAFYFPLNLLSSCPKLFSLSFYGDILPQTQLVCLQSLKKLEVDLVREVDVTFLNVILSGCPILETLEVSLFSTKSLITLRVPHSLKRLTFIVENENGACLEIEAPDLKYLCLTGITFQGNAIGNLHKVEEAYLDVFSPDKSVSVDHLLNLLRALSGIEHLVLCCSTTKWLYGILYFTYPKVELPEFRHLLHLELILPCFNLKFMFNVLQSCPMLQVLIVQDDQVPSSLSLPSEWTTQPISVPSCLISHLTFIHIKQYRGYFDEEFARYVLQNGLVLKTMRISGLSLDLKEKWERKRILRKFSNTPRGSVSCQLQFD